MKLYIAGFITGILASITFVILDVYTSPYEECKRKYTLPDERMECMWILENKGTFN